MQIIEGAGKVLQEEAKNVSKRGSVSQLQKKEYSDFFNFHWEGLHMELREQCPAILSVITSIVAGIPPSVSTKPFNHVLLTASIALHGRNQEMSFIQYLTGFLLTHGGCTQRDIERLSQIGLSVHPVSVYRKLSTWQDNLDQEILNIKEDWMKGGKTKFQLIGDNWDKNILPSYRTSDRKTISLHLFNIYAITDRVEPKCVQPVDFEPRIEIPALNFLPSVQEQKQLMKELTFIISTSTIQNHPQMNRHYSNVYPKHLNHEYTKYAGIKTKQYPLGLFDCNETKTAEVIQLLKELTQKYVPISEGNIVESVFFGGDRLTDERVQAAQNAMANGDSPTERLEGFISKIEDFHRLMNFLEAIHKMTYNTESGTDKCTAYYFRNLLNMRNVKGKVKNSYRAYKHLYYVIMDAIILYMFMNNFGVVEIDEDIQMPDTFPGMTDIEKISWIDNISDTILKEWFFDGQTDIFENLREIVGDPDHPENYWVSNLENGRVKCHHCEKTYAYVGSLKSHESKVHNVSIGKEKPVKKDKKQDFLRNHILMLFKLVLLHKNLDTAVDMGDGNRVVRSAKYEVPIYNKTNKIKYLIGSVHLTALTSGLLPADQSERLVANRFVNLQGGVNNNISLDEYLEMLNRDSKVACSGHQTKESILKHSKEYPHLVNMIKHFDCITQIRTRKGFHKIPSYQLDVRKVMKDFIDEEVLKNKPNRTFKCKTLLCERNPFDSCFHGLCTLIHRHRPKVPYHRLRDLHL